nr:YIP1 family protein [Chloroflexota bacterium]
MVERIIRIIRLDFPVFKEIESDPNATTEAAIVVAVSSVLSAIGSAVGSHRPVLVFFSGVIGGILGWIVWSCVSHFIGQAMFKSKGTVENMLRVIGYANAPRLLGIFGFIPCLRALASLIGAILALIAGIMAIREGLDLELGQAIIVAVVGWVALFIISIIIGAIFGVGAAGVGLVSGAVTR